ncbi:TRDC protein, partial [Sula dactylatra]|nr:TRDC protein [Sula dactylatra]
LKSKEPKQYDNKLNTACLARTFYPKNISLDVPKSDTVYDLKAPLVTSEGMYNTMKVVEVEPDAVVTCQAMHKGNKTTAKDKTEEFETVNACNIADASTKDVKMEKVNTLFMAILGLRVLLAKSIVLHTIMSIKLFLF